MGKVALIVGISGQDGAYLANLLLSKGYSVFGASRDAQASSFNNLRITSSRKNNWLIRLTVTIFIPYDPAWIRMGFNSS